MNLGGIVETRTSSGLDCSQDANSHPINVCFMIDRLRPAGTEMQLLAMIRAFDRRRIRPHLCLLDGEDETSRSMEPIDCPILRLGIRRLLSPSSLARAMQLRRFLRQHRIDVLQPHFPDSIYLGIPVARLAGVKRILFTRRDCGYWVTPAHRRIGSLLNRLTYRTIANSEGARLSAIMDYSLDPRKVLVFENGVDLSRFENISVCEPTHTIGELRVVGLVANLRPEKNPELFVRVAHQLLTLRDDVVFRIAGEGELRPALGQLAVDLGIQDRVHLAGTVTDTPGFLAQLDVAVLCSVTEGLSNALLEYMAAGRAIVATAVGGNTRLIASDEDGILVPAGDIDAMTRAIDRLLSNLGVARAMGKAAREKVSRHFSLAMKTRELEAFYRTILSSLGGAEPI